ncbi:hypothetical protein [Marinomonas flavescens]|uniref:hypothetical protein n=1 Tax=Marinomonas flavescens TaxID=2529379 RepID=UPI001056C12D|nr:hypothetical protein [Marinomonas flavescens]
MEEQETTFDAKHDSSDRLMLASLSVTTRGLFCICADASSLRDRRKQMEEQETTLTTRPRGDFS